MSERWTTADIAAVFGIHRGAARKLLSRWRQEGNPAATAVGRDPWTDAKLYDPDLVRAAHDARPGRGANLRSRTTTGGSAGPETTDLPSRALPAPRRQPGFNPQHREIRRLDVDVNTVGECPCVHGPCLLHAGHCCFRESDSTCHQGEIMTADPSRATVEAAPGVWLIQASWTGDVLWFWQCRECDDGFGPLTGRVGAEVGARAHRHLEDGAVTR